MTKLEETYSLLDKENIEVKNINMDTKGNAFIMNYDGNYYIGLNKYNLDNINEYIVLNEELGHYYTNSLYKVYNNPTWINKMEYRAKKWQINRLVPADKLKQYKDKTVYELAELFDVTIDFMRQSIDYYKELGICNV